MDSPHFTWLCFLLLTIAAPRPGIAMPSDNPAEGTQDSSFDKTHVTVYHCKDCESNICKSPNYEDFVKIGETQNETFLSKTIQLVTNETHIVMCFQQENTFPEGIYAIIWEKAIGIGESCGSPNSGASSENVRGNIIKICCEAETDLSVPNTALKCYTKMSDEKTRRSTADITDEGNPGNPQFSISEKSSIGIITPVLILAVCAVALAVYCVRQKRNGQGPVIVLHQTFNDIFPSILQLLEKPNGLLTRKSSHLFEKHLQMRKPGLYASSILLANDVQRSAEERDDHFIRDLMVVFTNVLSPNTCVH